MKSSIEQALMGEEIERIKAQPRATWTSKAFRKAKPGAVVCGIVENLRDFDISEELIEAAQKAVELERT
ncbi:MAG: hypothetical protein LBU32_04815 [Clostridiales bacterium]|jgi:hypothetical protein|nr:hypothetical protein [Clostridiales bacterium]